MPQTMGFSQRLPTFVLLIHLIMQLTETYSHESEPSKVSPIDIKRIQMDNDASQSVMVIQAAPLVMEQILSNISDVLSHESQLIKDQFRWRSKRGLTGTKVRVDDSAKQSGGWESKENLDQIDVMAGYEPQKIDATKTSKNGASHLLTDSQNSATNIATVPSVQYYDVPRQRHQQRAATWNNQHPRSLNHLEYQQPKTIYNGNQRFPANQVLQTTNPYPNLPLPTAPAFGSRSRVSSTQNSAGRHHQIIHHPPTTVKSYQSTYLPQRSIRRPQNYVARPTAGYVHQTFVPTFPTNNLQTQNSLAANVQSYRVKPSIRPSPTDYSLDILSKYDTVPRPFSKPSRSRQQHVQTVPTAAPQHLSKTRNGYQPTSSFQSHPTTVIPITQASHLVPTVPPVQYYKNDKNNNNNFIVQHSQDYLQKPKDKEEVTTLQPSSYKVKEDIEVGPKYSESSNANHLTKDHKSDFGGLDRKPLKSSNYEVTERNEDSEKETTNSYEPSEDYSFEPNTYEIPEKIKKELQNSKLERDSFRGRDFGDFKGEFIYDPESLEEETSGLKEEEEGSETKLEPIEGYRVAEPSEDQIPKDSANKFQIRVLDQVNEGTHEHGKGHGEAEGKDESHEEGDGGEHKEEHHEEHGDNGVEKYDSKHEHEKGAKGYHEKEDHEHHYEEEKGEAGDHKDEEGYHKEHHEEEAGEKQASFNEKGKHEKGHSTQGQHSVHKKDEFEKKTEFFDEFSEEDGEEKGGEYQHDHHSEKGGHHKSGHFHGEHDKELHAQSGKHLKGHSHHEEKGHDNHEGHGQHHHHDEKHGKSAEHAEKKQWEYKNEKGDEKGEEKKHE